MGIVKKAAGGLVKLKYKKRESNGVPAISNQRIRQFQQLYVGTDARQAVFEHERTQLEGILIGCLLLPPLIGILIYYNGPFHKDNIYLAVLFIAMIILNCFVKDAKLKERIKERNTQMLLDYSEIVAKFTILMDCGMSVKGAFKKIADNYALRVKQGDMKNRYAYEEICLIVHMMENGVYEGKAYAAFAERCRLHSYVKFGRLLEQNIKMGNKHIRMLLEYEVSEAFEARKNLAKRLGEEAGTKLLLPMMVMLLLVLVIILVPAFLSFSI